MHQQQGIQISVPLKMKISPKILAKGTNKLSPSDQILAQTLPHLTGFFKGSQNNEKDVKSIFQQPFHGCQCCQIVRSVTLPVTQTRHFQDARRF